MNDVTWRKVKRLVAADKQIKALEQYTARLATERAALLRDAKPVDLRLIAGAKTA